MKIRNLILGLGVAGAMVACDSKAPETTAKAETTATETEKQPTGETSTYMVDTEASNIRWEGGTSGVSVYSHFGNISLQEGTLVLAGNTLTGGNFIVDMKTIDPQDEGYSEEHPKTDLIGHLSTGDFFLVEEYPTASFKITSV